MTLSVITQTLWPEVKSRWTGKSNGPPLSNALFTVASPIQCSPTSHRMWRRFQDVWTPLLDWASPQPQTFGADPVVCCVRGWVTLVDTVLLNEPWKYFLWRLSFSVPLVFVVWVTQTSKQRGNMFQPTEVGWMSNSNWAGGVRVRLSHIHHVDIFTTL